MKIAAISAAGKDGKTVSLSKKDMAQIEERIEAVGRRLMLAGRKQSKNWRDLVSKRLYSYPQLQANIKRYERNIEDYKKEDFKKSKSIVTFFANSGNSKPPELEEIRATKISLEEHKIERDKAEIEEIEAALEVIKDDQYYRIIELKFFENKTQEDIAAETSCAIATISRNMARLLDIMSVALYGADVLPK